MARYSKTLTPQSQAAFLAALRGGALVVAAARAAGVAVSSLYCRRARDAGFAAAWAAAVEASTPLWRRPPAPLAGANPARRARLAGWRRDAFLAALADTCHAADAAAAAGIDKATVHRLIRRDPGFARDCAAAVARGTAHLFREDEAERAAARAWRLPIAPTGRPTQDFDEAIRLLARWERRDGSLGRRFVRHGRMTRWSFDDAMALLARRLRGLGFAPAGEEDKGAASG